MKDTIKAHSGTLWSMHIRPDGRGLVTGGADKDVKFWDVEEKRINEDDVCKGHIRRAGTSETDIESAQISDYVIANPYQNTEND